MYTFIPEDALSFLREKLVFTLWSWLTTEFEVKYKGRSVYNLYINMFFYVIFLKNYFKTRPTVNYFKPDFKPWNAQNDILESFINKQKGGKHHFV